MFETNNIKTNIQYYYQLIKFSIEMRFLYHETIFFICENKKIKDKKTSHVIKCVIILLFFMLRKLRYIEYQAI